MWEQAEDNCNYEKAEEKKKKKKRLSALTASAQLLSLNRFGSFQIFPELNAQLLLLWQQCNTDLRVVLLCWLDARNSLKNATLRRKQ